MSDKITRGPLPPNPAIQGAHSEVTRSSPDEETSRFIGEANSTHKNLRDFFKYDAKECQFVSLGETCSSAWYLKQVGLKKKSYPFDWIFSTPEIVLDCINDNFCKFMDKSLIKPKQNNLSAGHLYYHNKLFNHRNPLRSNEDYDYYRRCCNRFMNLIRAQQNIVYLITLINEPDKRPGWANGFTQNFSMPGEQNHKTVQDLIGCLKKYNQNSQFIIVDHYTNHARGVTSEWIDESTFFIKFCAGGDSTGIYFSDHLDDFCFKLIVAGLCKSS